MPVWTIFYKFLLLLLRRSRPEYTEAHYFVSDFGMVASVTRTRPRSVFLVRTSEREVLVSRAHLFRDSEYADIGPKDLVVGTRVATVDGFEEVTAVHRLPMRAHMYTMRVIGTPRQFSGLNLSNGFVSEQSALGHTRVRVGNELLRVNELVARSPAERLVEWLESKLVRVCTRHLEQIVKSAD